MAKNKYIHIKMLKENEQIKHMTSARKKKNHTLHVMTFVSGICFGLYQQPMVTSLFHAYGCYGLSFCLSLLPPFSDPCPDGE